MKIYLSSTNRDLAEHHATVDLALRRMSHDVIGMEQYVAEGGKPLDRCLADVRSADAYLLILAWRYGYIPQDPANPLKRSITELEYEAAIASGKPVLAFLLEPSAPWPASSMDAISGGGGEDILRFRSVIGAEYLSGIFRSPDNLASQVVAAVSALGMNRRIAERALKQADMASDVAHAFGGGLPLGDTTLISLRSMVTGVGETRALRIALGQGVWWSTRLYLLATLLHNLTGVKQIVFAHQDGSFAGMASPAAVRDGLMQAFPAIASFDTDLRKLRGSKDVDREIDRTITLWKQRMEGSKEAQLKVDVRWGLIVEWLGERLVRRCVRVDETGLTMIQVQQIVDSLIPDVPVEWPPEESSGPEPARPTIRVIDRDGFGLELAREWVRTGLPRAPVR